MSSSPLTPVMKVCCFGKQPDSDASGGLIETDESGSDTPTSHFAESNTISKDVAAQLSDCTLKVEGKELKAHSQVLAMKSPLLADVFLATKGKGRSAELDASMEGISYEAMQLLLRYMYSADPGRFINSLTIEQVEKVAPLADRFHILPFKDDCDSVLRGKVMLSMKEPEAVLQWALMAERCRLPTLQAKCEAFLAGNFAALKHHVALNDLGKDTWMRLMYAANYTGSSCMETLLRLWITQGFFPYPTKA